MADRVTFEAKGFKELLERMQGLPQAVGARALASAGRKAMRPVFEDTVRLVPVHTGILRASVRLAATSAGSGKTGVVNAGVTVKRAKLTGEIEIADGVTERYKLESHADASWRWHFVEFGTSLMPAHPFLRPAFNANVQTVISRLREAIAANVERAWAKQAQPKD